MVKRDSVKKAHENALIDAFIDWYNEEYDCSYVVESFPDPPDAIMVDNESGEITWIEVFDVFYSADWARDQFSHATEGEENYNMSSKGHGYMNMDKQVADRFVYKTKDKLSKSSYAKATDEYGPGILVVLIDSPWFDDQTIEEMDTLWNQDEELSNAGNFDEMYIVWRINGGFDFQEWELPE